MALELDTPHGPARVHLHAAAETGAIGVLCLAFPLHPPGRPETTRLAELEAVELPVLIVQGESDPFGMPPPASLREVVPLRGNHGRRSDAPGCALPSRAGLSAC